MYQVSQNFIWTDAIDAGYCVTVEFPTGAMRSEAMLGYFQGNFQLLHSNYSRALGVSNAFLQVSNDL